MAISIKKFMVDYQENPVGIGSACPEFSWIIESDQNNVKQSSYRIKVYEWINTLVYDTGLVNSDETHNITYKGDILNPDTPYFVTLEATINGNVYTKECTFRTGLYVQFPTVMWIRPNVKEDEYTFSPYIRKDFNIDNNEIAYATLYVTAKGWFEPYVNGTRPIENEVMAPACMRDYSKAFLNAYDVTSMLKTGQNTLGFMLGAGYSNHFRYYTHYFGGRRIWAFLSVVFTDGEYLHIGTDESWKWAKSPIISDHIYDGETYDASLEIKDWNLPLTSCEGWQNVAEAKFREEVVANIGEPVKILDTRPTDSVKKIADNKYIYDFKYNGSGVVKIKVKGEKGSKITIRHAENLHPDGTLQTWTNRNALATDIYILSGEGEEAYAPRFTYHCFRYAEIEIEGNAEILSAEALVYGTDMMNQSEFTCSSDMINRIQQNFIRTLKTNFMSWPCDTGVRDERTPCSMDIMVYEDMAMKNCNAHNYFVRWFDKRISNGKPDWAGDSIVLAYLLIKNYGDIKIVKENYELLRGLSSSIYNNYLQGKFEDGFGDWSAPNPTNEYEDSFSSVLEVEFGMMYIQMNMMKEIAELLHYEDDALTYESYAYIAKQEYFNRFYNSNTHLFSDGKQTPNLLALCSGMLNKKEEKAVLNALIKSIKEKDNSHLDTGIFGTRKLIEVLSKNEEGKELVYDILHQTTYPSFGHQIVGRDATTAWEQWYNLQGMMTCSHSMFAGIGTDFYKYFAGIKTVNNAYKEVIIKPEFSKRLTSVNCVLETPRGIYKVNWNNQNGFKINVEIPANCCATVVLPNGKKHKVASGKYSF